MIQRKVFKYRMYPTAEQEQALTRFAGCCRWVWNAGLAARKDFYQKSGVTLPMRFLKAQLPLLKKAEQTKWLAECDSQALQESLLDLDKAFQAFFERRAGFPRFKKKGKSRHSFSIPQRVTVADGFVSIPKIGKVQIAQSRDPEGKSKGARFVQDACGDWFVSLICEFQIPDVALLPADPERVIGVDLGLKDFAVFSDDRPSLPAPRFARKQGHKMRRLQKQLARQQKQSKRGLRTKRKIALLHRRIVNQRQNFIHKLTTELVVKYDAICIEDLNVKGLAKTKLARSILDAALGEFRKQVTYKTTWYRKHLGVIDRFYPSSKLHRKCGWINDGLTLSDRFWWCQCGDLIDRDKNAARNIKAQGLTLIPTRRAGHVESLNACRETVSLLHAEASLVEARIPRLKPGGSVKIRRQRHAIFSDFGGSAGRRR